jgi:sugar phosphate isomerase/epimerase
MFEKLGIVTNIWAKCLERGDRFEDLLALFYKNGFKHMEIRDGDDLRRSEFGEFLGGIEAAMARYTDAEWNVIGEKIAVSHSSSNLIKTEDHALFDHAKEFFEMAAGVVFSYAMAHPWHVPPDAIDADNRHISQAKKLAYFFCPNQPRLRLVDPEFSGEVDASTTIANLNRYREILPDYPLVLAVENAQLSAPLTLDLARQGGVLLAYDEANTFNTDGTSRTPPADFWDAVRVDFLTSVHLKQKTSEGVTYQIQDGYVDFKAILKRLKKDGYHGDLLLENAPTDQPFQDAVQSREYLSKISDTLVIV